MKHRYLTVEDYGTISGIDSIIAHGRCFHRRQLMRSARHDAGVLDLLERAAREGSTSNELQHIEPALYLRWLRWVERQRAIDDVRQTRRA